MLLHIHSNTYTRTDIRREKDTHREREREAQYYTHIDIHTKREKHNTHTTIHTKRRTYKEREKHTYTTLTIDILIQYQ